MVMATSNLKLEKLAGPVFPAAEIERRLRLELKAIESQSSQLRPEWEPLLDSKRVVGTILAIEDLFQFRIPPDKVVRKGGYVSIDEATTDILNRVKLVWETKTALRGRK